MMHEDRLRVQTRLGVNLVVEAGAGTGKTTALIDRLCLCVLVQQIPVEKIVALTFTEKAAAEIKTRFVFKLQHLIELVQLSKQQPPAQDIYQQDPRYRTLRLLREHFHISDEDLVARARAALDRLDRSSIGTIHSFCAEILKMYPLEAGLSPLAEIDTGQKANQLFEERWNTFLDQQLGVDAPRSSLWKQALASLNLEDLKQFAKALCAIKPVEYNYYSHREFLSKIITEQAQRAEQLLQAHLSENRKPRALEKALLWAVRSLRRTQLFLTQQDLSAMPAEQCPAVSSTRYKDWEENELEEAQALIGFAQKLTPENQTLFLTAQTLVDPLAQQVRNLYVTEGVLSFDDLIIRTRNLLKENLYVRRLLKEKFDVLFIDEFQDTDPIQGELLLFLAEEKTGTASCWQDVKLLPGKLFVVGDPKQSIYRFRGADITAYELFTDLILKQGGEKCFLQGNYRSAPEIVALANEVCSRVMLQESTFQPAYVPIFPTRHSRAQAIEWLFVTQPPEIKIMADEGRHNQAEMIAKWIKENVGKFTLSNGQVLRYCDIAVLTRVGTTTRIYTDALRRYGIAFNTQTDKDFFQKQELNDFLSFLRVIADPEDQIAWVGVLRSPLVGLTDEQLYQLANRGTFILQTLRTNPLTQDIATTVQYFHELTGRVSLKHLLERVLQETFLPEVCAAAYDGENSLNYLQQFVRLADQYEQQNASLISFLAQLQERLANPEDFALPPMDDSADAVSILTVHKSKGLEFPVVILADLSRKETAVNANLPDHLFSWQHNMYGLRVGNVCDINLAFLEEEQKKHARCESVRILYVALTRAKEKLLLVADGRSGSQKAGYAFGAAGVWPDAKINFVKIPGANLTIPVTYRTYQNPRTFIYQTLPAPHVTDFAWQDIKVWKQAQEERLRVYQQALHTKIAAPSALMENDKLTQQQQQAAQLGTICHRVLEILMEAKAQDVKQACVEGARLEGDPHRAMEAETLLGPFVSSALYAQLISCKRIATEMPFVLPLADGTCQQGIMDCVLEKSDGNIWIVDYKTDQVSPGKEKEYTIQKYKLQLEAYRDAAKQIFPGKKITVSAVFIRTFAAVEL